MQKNETADSSVLHERVYAAWRTRACAAALSVGTQVFLLGCGIAMPLCLNSAWIASLASLPACAAAVWACRRTIMIGAEHQRGAEPLPDRAKYLFLSLTLAADAALALAALISLTEQSLLTQARTLFITGAAVAAALLCALSRSTGVSRLCFALRWALPLAAALLTAISIPLDSPVGLFPLLGAGPFPLAAACACMLPSALPVLTLLLPPPELEEIDGALCEAFIPDTSFFLRRVLAGAAFGCLLLFALCACSTYESIATQHTWGQRLRILSAGQPHEGIPQALLAACQLLVLFLLCVNMLCAAEQALLRARPGFARLRMGLLALCLLLALIVLALIVNGFDKALFAAPWLALPAMMCPFLLQRRKEKRP